METTDFVGFMNKFVQLNESKKNSNGSNNGNSGTSNVSVIAPKMEVNDLKSFIMSEIATSRNIKSALNRKAVGDSLRSMHAKLKGLKEIPSNGIAMYAGQCI